MFVIEISSSAALIGLAGIVVVVAGLTFYFWNLRRMQYRQAAEANAAALREVTAEAVAAILKATTDNNAAVLELVRQLKSVQDDISNLAPDEVRTALTRVAKLHAKDMTEGYLDKLKASKEKIDLYQLWLKALTGNQSELGQAARRGFPEEMPEALAGRIEAVIAQRWRGHVNGRETVTSYLAT
jgi:hypothetical protein